MNGNSSSSDFASGLSCETFDTVTHGFIDDNVCGEGASCIVYKIRHGDLQVAVKRLRKELIGKAEYRSSYRKEFQIGQRLKHDALPVYRNLRDDIEEVYIEMDYLDGITLEDFIRTQEGKEYFTSTENTERFLRELLNVVFYLHRSGVIHCDLKPANIMLRHSDRGVMLIDLDKAYSDIRNNNHGGTRSFSDPLGNSSKPTAFKDISAIGIIVDRIAEEVPGFPSSKFKRFKKECLNEQFSENRLYVLLNPKSNRNPFIIAAIISIAVVIAMLIWNRAVNDRQSDSLDILPKAIQDYTDTIVRMTEEKTTASLQPESTPTETIQQESLVSVHAQTDKPQISIQDVDSQTADFTAKVETAYKALDSGLTRDQLQEYLFDLAQTYLASYQAIVMGAKLRNPDIPEIDVELAVAREYEQSRAGKLYTKFNKAVSDTLRNWDKDLDDNLY